MATFAFVAIAVAGAPARRSLSGGVEEGFIAANPATGAGGGVNVTVESVVPSSSLSAGWGAVRIDLYNTTTESQPMTLDASDDLGRQTTSLRLAPGERATTYFAARLGSGWMIVNANATAIGRAVSPSVSTGSSGWQQIVVLDVDRGGSRAGLQTILSDLWAEALSSKLSLGSSRSRSAPNAFPVDVASLPDRWTLFSVADLVLVDGVAIASRPEAQRALARYVAAGGALVLSNAKEAGAGALDELVSASVDTTQTKDGTRTGRYGFGRWVAVEGSELSDVTARAMVVEVLAARVAATADDVGILPHESSMRLAIPGLGEVPARAFFAWVALFALLVGVAAFVLQRRSGRRTALVVIVPILGVLFTGGILVYGILAEGLGTRGAVRSVTFLDQRAHDAVCCASRTLYAGIGPDVLRVSPDTLLSPSNTSEIASSAWRAHYGYRSRHENAARAAGWSWTAAGGVVDGGAVPSRTPTGIGSVTVTRARERLRFKRHVRGFETVAEAAFAPVPGKGGVLFRHKGGTYYLRGEDGVLTPIQQADVERSIFSILGRHRVMELESAPRTDYDDLVRYGIGRSSAMTEPAPSTPPADRLSTLVGDPLPSGSYLALMTSAPGFDDLGLTVDWTGATHVVMGLLAEEDVDD